MSQKTKNKRNSQKACLNTHLREEDDRFSSAKSSNFVSPAKNQGSERKSKNGIRQSQNELKKILGKENLQTKLILNTVAQTNSRKQLETC